MAKRKTLQDLSVDELRWLLMEKRRHARQERLERFRRTGRVVSVAPEVSAATLESWQTTPGQELDDPLLLPARSRWRLLDGFLLLIEVSAVVGFLFILFNSLSLMKELNQEVAIALEQPTLTPTPLIAAVVLPSGHTPPNTAGGARFNEEEIPPHLRPLVQSLASVVVPTPGPEQARRIQIPAIGVDAPVVQGDGWEQLKKGVGQHLDTSNPGTGGNMVFSAHNDIFGEIFRDLDRLKPGDPVIVYTNQRAFTYLVTGTQIVAPVQVEVMAQTSQPTLTLISCYPYLKDNKRIVVSARLASSGD